MHFQTYWMQIEVQSFTLKTSVWFSIKVFYFFCFFPPPPPAYNSDINIFLLLILQTQLFLGFSIVFYSYSTLGPVLLFFLFNQISTVQVNKLWLHITRVWFDLLSIWSIKISTTPGPRTMLFLHSSITLRRNRTPMIKYSRTWCSVYWYDLNFLPLSTVFSLMTKQLWMHCNAQM